MRPYTPHRRSLSTRFPEQLRQLPDHFPHFIEYSLGMGDGKVLSQPKQISTPRLSAFPRHRQRMLAVRGPRKGEVIGGGEAPGSYRIHEEGEVVGVVVPVVREYVESRQSQYFL